MGKAKVPQHALNVLPIIGMFYPENSTIPASTQLWKQMQHIHLLSAKRLIEIQKDRTVSISQGLCRHLGSSVMHLLIFGYLFYFPFEESVAIYLQHETSRLSLFIEIIKMIEQASPFTYIIRSLVLFHLIFVDILIIGSLISALFRI